MPTYGTDIFTWPLKEWSSTVFAHIKTLSYKGIYSKSANKLLSRLMACQNQQMLK